MIEMAYLAARACLPFNLETVEMKVLITGAAGRIGRALSEAFADDYSLILIDRLAPRASSPTVTCLQADLSDEDSLSQAMKDVDCVVHLAAIAEERPLEELIQANIVTTYRVFEAARHARVKRVVFASSIQTVGFHPMSAGLTQGSRIRPSGYYGVSKAAGEAIARLYADKYGMSVACLRIGSFESAPLDERQLSTWLGPSDCVQLFRACIEAGPFSFVMVYGISANQHSIIRDGVPSGIDYQPHADGERFRSKLRIPSNPKGADLLFVGGEYCGRGFVGNFDRIE